MAKIKIKSLIHNLYARSFGKKSILFLVLLGITLLIISLFNRYIYIDDVFFGEQSYYLLKEKIVKIPSLVGFMGCDEHLFSYHKLHVFIGALIIKLFGFSPNPLRITSLVLFVFLEFLLFKYGKFKGYSPHVIVISMFFLFFNPLIILYSFTFRPEIWVVLAGFSSYFMLERFLKKSNLVYLISSGILAGISFLLHLNGLIFPVAGALLLIFRKKIVNAVIFSMVAGSIGLLYFWDLWQPGHFDTWIYQLKHWPDNNITNYNSSGIFILIKNILIKALNEQQRFFWSYKVWATSILFFTVLISDFSNLRKNHNNLLVYLLILIITLNIAGSQIAERYLIYYLPFMALVVGIGIVHLFEKKQYWAKAILILMLGCQIGFTVKMFGEIMVRNNKYTQIHQELLSKLPDKNERVLVPYQFLFNQIDEYNMVSFKAFEYYEKQNNLHFNHQSFFNRALQLQIKYIIIPKDKIMVESTSIECLNKVDEIVCYGYKEIYSDENAIILEQII